MSLIFKGGIIPRGTLKGKMIPTEIVQKFTTDGPFAPTNGGDFGQASQISADGNTCVVGAPNTPNNYGVVFVFTRTNNIWTQQAYILYDDRTSQDYMGKAVSISGDGDTIVAGSDQIGSSNIGGVMVCTRSGSTWTQYVLPIPGGGDISDGFGASLDISADGQTIAVGEPGYTNGIGRVSIFKRNGLSWDHQATLWQVGNGKYDFGRSVSLSADGNTAIVGSPGYANNSQTSGAAYTYTRSGNTWTTGSRLLSSDLQAGDEFGESVSISPDGQTAIIGSPFEDTGGSSAGSAYTFTRSGNTFTEQQKIQSSTPIKDAKFGESLDILSDGTALIGAPTEDYNGLTKVGAAYVFTLTDGVWTEQRIIRASSPAIGDWFGKSVSITDDSKSMLIGQSNNGTGYVYSYIDTK